MNSPQQSIPTRPQLWNPTATASWSVLFTPVFGAWLQAINWRELNQPDLAKQSMIWVYAGVAFLAAVFFLPDTVGSGPAFGFLIAWYFASGKKQLKFVKENNINYERKKWGKPLLFALAGLVFYLAIAGAVELATQPSQEKMLESESVSLVTQIVQEQLGGSATCKAVTIEKKVSDGFYHGVAYLDNGSTLKIAVELKGDQILVTIPGEQ